MSSDIILHTIDSEWAMWIARFDGAVIDFLPKISKPSEILRFTHLQDLIWQNFQVHYQIFNLEFFFNVDQIKQILILVKSVFDHQDNISNQPSTEFLLFYANTRQITQAIELVGIKNPPKPNQAVHWGQLLFGPCASLRTAVEFLKNHSNLTSINDLQCCPQENIETIMNFYHISLQEITMMVKIAQIEIDKPIDSINDLLNTVTSNHIQSIISTAIIHRCLRLYLDNVRQKSTCKEG